MGEQACYIDEIGHELVVVHVFGGSQRVCQCGMLEVAQPEYAHPRMGNRWKKKQEQSQSGDDQHASVTE